MSRLPRSLLYRLPPPLPPTPVLAVLAGLLAACAPITAGPMPTPLAAGATSSIELSVASARAPELREEPALSDPPLPHAQIHAASAFRLHPRVEAGPSFLLDLGLRADPGVVTGGLFVRWWTTAPDAELQAAIRVEAGWAWGGLGTDLVLPVSEDAAITLAPTATVTPAWAAGRLPVGAVLRLEPVSLGIEAGLSGGIGLGGTGPRSAPWLAMRVRIAL